MPQNKGLAYSAHEYNFTKVFTKYQQSHKKVKSIWKAKFKSTILYNKKLRTTFSDSFRIGLYSFPHWIGVADHTFLCISSGQYNTMGCWVAWTIDPLSDGPMFQQFLQNSSMKGSKTKPSTHCTVFPNLSNNDWTFRRQDDCPSNSAFQLIILEIDWF